MSCVIQVTYKVVTPLFCGGARPAAAELRLPSFKGILRWWWRALAYSRCGGDLARIAEGEEELFGSARRGRGRVAMRLLQPGTGPSRPLKAGEILRLGQETVGEGARYLGYGVMEAFARRARAGRSAVAAGQLTRACLSAPFLFKLELRARDLDDPKLKSLLDALQAAGLFGGVGAKNRKGYGSLVLQSLVVDGEARWSPPATLEDLAKRIRRLLPGPSQVALPGYTALSGRTRVVLVARGGENRPLGLLDRIGKEMVRFRSWGHNGRVLGEPREGNFKGDHDLMKARGHQRARIHPERIIFGLPHDYGKDPDDKVGPSGRLDRRASPLLIHLHECGTAGNAVGVLALLPAVFLPGNDRAEIFVGRTPVPIAPEQKLWAPLHQFLDRCLDRQRCRELDEATEVRP